MNEKILKFLNVVVKIAAVLQAVAQVVAQAFPVSQVKSTADKEQLDSFFKERL